MILSILVQGCKVDASVETAPKEVYAKQETAIKKQNNSVKASSQTKKENTKINTTGKNTVTQKTTTSNTSKNNSSKTDQEKKPAATSKPKTSTNGLATPASCGALQVKGTQLVDKNGKAVQLKGVSTHGLAWFPEYVNKECFQQLRQQWNANVVRLAMYTAEYGGYCEGGNKEQLKKLVHNGVKYATELDMYVIIDWHILRDQNPNTYKKEAKAFFSEMARTYKNHNNVIYEICNEPNGGVSWAEIKSYAEQIIPAIRAHDKDAIIIVGTPNWSQYVDQAAADPIIGHKNIMYALHYYAATHKDSLRNTMTKAIDAGLPIFVSEYGICDASGSGGIDEKQANEWVKTMNSYKVSYVAWSLCNKNETAAMIRSDCKKTSGFSQSDLSASGKWLYEMLTGKKATQLQEQPAKNKSESTSKKPDTSGNTTATNQKPSSGKEENTQEKKTTTQGSLKTSLELTNSWESEGKTFYMYNLTIQNTSKKECTNWNVSLKFSKNIGFSNGWNGKYTANKNVLRIKNADYNGTIPAKGSVSGIGFIISGPSGLRVK